MLAAMTSLCVTYESSEADALKKGFSLKTFLDVLERVSQPRLHKS